MSLTISLALAIAGCLPRGQPAQTPARPSQEGGPDKRATARPLRKVLLFLPNRVLDTMDLFGLKFMLGIGHYEAKVQATEGYRFGLAYVHAGGLRLGCIGRQPAFECEPHSASAWFHHWGASTEDSPSDHRESPGRPDEKSDLALAISGPPLVFVPPPTGGYLGWLFDPSGGWGAPARIGWYVLALFPTAGLELRFRPSQVGDWLAGWAGCDPSGDDIR